MLHSTRLTIWLVLFIPLITISVGKRKFESFFEKFGYLPGRGKVDRTQGRRPEEIEKAIIKFQRFNGLKVNGILDKATRKKMFGPRCGVKDIEYEGAFRRVRKWWKTDLTWNLKEFSKTSDLTQLQQLNAIKKAFDHWASVTPLTFREVPHGGDIEIRFAIGSHGDKNSFDGPGGVLAHAFYPSNGDTHFDDAEKWTLKTTDGVNLEIVATHEFGHALGLGHSQVSTSLMAPYYKGYTPDFKLDLDDINGIQSLYDKRKPPTTLPPRTTTAPPTTLPPSTTMKRLPNGPGYCRRHYQKINALIRVLGRVDYIFVDEEFVISSKSGEKKRIRDIFKNGPSSVEAALYSIETNEVYLTYGNRLWAFSVWESGTTFTLETSYPKKLENFGVSHMDALMGLDMSYAHYRSVRIFIIKNGNFWELVPNSNYVSSGHGYPIAQFFQNVPNRIDSVLTVGPTVYFLSNNMLYPMKVSDRVVSSTGIPLKEMLLTCRYN